ncbi:MAG: T9SS type A sorting domain-containing protein [Bacteroidales bacterium]|nr:T9SS type A sorting domain-containing protein [Bacteroidales bacterium]
MKKFFMILATLLIGSMCVAQHSFSISERLMTTTPATAERSAWIGNQSGYNILGITAGHAIIMRGEQFSTSYAIGNVITKVKFYTVDPQNLTGENASNYSTYTNNSFTIKIYEGGQYSEDYTRYGAIIYTEGCYGTEMYSQAYTQTAFGENIVELTTPYTISSTNFWIIVECAGNSIFIMNLTEVGDLIPYNDFQTSANPSLSTQDYMFSESYETGDIVNNNCLYYLVDEQNNIQSYNAEICLAFFVDDSSDFEARLFGSISNNMLNSAETSYTLNPDDSLTLFPFFYNHGTVDAVSGTITFDITAGGTSLMDGEASVQLNSAEQISIPVGGWYALLEEPYSFTLTAQELFDMGLSGTFDICFTFSYSGNDPDLSNNNHCIPITIQSYHISVYSNNENMGYVSGGGDFIYGTETNISATPYTGYRFVRWNDNNTDNPRTITVTGDASYTAYFEAIPQYTINVIPSPSSYGYTYGNGTYYEGTEITISATAYDGYRFSYWSDGNTNSTRTITVTGNATYTAYFEINAEQYNIDVYSSNTNYGSTYGGGTYYEGSSITIGATAYSGYRFSGWNDNNTDNPRTITVTGNATYIANFEAIPQYTINVNPSSPNFGYTYGSGTYYEGTEITIWAEAYSGCRFVRWNDGNTNTTRTITVTENATYVAIFEEIPQYTITVRPSNPNYGTTWGGGTYTEGTEITIGVEPYDGYRFIGWNDGDTNTTRTITVTENAIYTAIIEEIPPQYTITVISSNPEYGTAFGGGTFERGTLISISAEAYDGYIFTSWNDNNTMNPRTVEVVADATFIANFSDISTVNTYTITVLSANPEYGTVSGGGTYAEGTVITITAEPNDGYEFLQWNDGITRNPRMVGVTADATFIATFAELPPEPEYYTINVYTSNPEQGAVTGGGTFIEGSEITIEAIPNNGFLFTSWDDGNHENPRRITVVDNAEYTALFADITTVNTYTITVYSSNPNYGSVAGEGTYAEGTIVTISALANNGYQFKQWNDGNMDNPRQITVVADATYIATFVRGSAIEESYANEISIFPNPTSDILNITSSEEISSIEIVNAIGQIVLRMDVNSDNAVCNLEAINAGVYFVRIYQTVDMSSEQIMSVKKFVKE